MLASVIFGALASLATAVFALRQGLLIEEAFALYMAVSVFAIVGVSALCALRRQAVRRWHEKRRHVST